MSTQHAVQLIIQALLELHDADQSLSEPRTPAVVPSKPIKRPKVGEPRVVQLPRQPGAA